MPRLESVKRLMRRVFTSIPFFIALGVGLGALIAILVIPRPMVATITISGEIIEQDYTDDILGLLRQAQNNDNIKAVVLQINSPGGQVSAVEQIYLDLLRLRQHKPVVASVGMVGLSGGYYIAVASNFIYAEPTSLLGNIGAWVTLPSREKVEEDVIASGPFKATGGSRRKATGMLEMVRQEFIDAVIAQRGNQLKLSEEELSRAEIYVGVDGLRYGLIDDIGTGTTAIEKAANLAGIRHYGVMEMETAKSVNSWAFGSSDMEDLKAKTSTVPIYYYLYFEPE